MLEVCECGGDAALLRAVVGVRGKAGFTIAGQAVRARVWESARVVAEQRRCEWVRGNWTEPNYGWCSQPCRWEWSRGEPTNQPLKSHPLLGVGLAALDKGNPAVVIEEGSPPPPGVDTPLVVLFPCQVPFSLPIVLPERTAGESSRRRWADANGALCLLALQRPLPSHDAMPKVDDPTRRIIWMMLMKGHNNDVTKKESDGSGAGLT